MIFINFNIVLTFQFNNLVSHHPFRRVFAFRDNTYIFFSNSDGNFFAAKEVSLLDDRNQGKQSIFQLRQVRGLGLSFKLNYIIYFS